MENLPSSINAHIFRFLSHPVADAIRNRITEFQAFSSQYGSSDLHTFYIFFFLDRKMDALPKLLDEMYERLGVSVGIDSDYFRPSLWSSTRANSLGTFRSTTLSTIIGQPFGRAKKILSNIIIYRIHVKD